MPASQLPHRTGDVAWRSAAGRWRLLGRADYGSLKAAGVVCDCVHVCVYMCVCVVIVCVCVW